MSNRTVVIFAVVMSAIAFGPARAADPKPSGQCWSDGTCLSDSLVPVAPPKVEPGEDKARFDNGRPFYRPPVYILNPPVIYTPSAPTPSICYILTNGGVYTPITCPPPAPVALPRARYHR
jgi:hypothetical protein